MNDNDNEEKILLNNYRPLLINDKISENTSLLYIMKCQPSSVDVNPTTRKD